MTVLRLKPGGIVSASLMMASMASPASAQVLSGNIYGQVRDESEGVIREAAVQLRGPNIGGLSTTSNAQGQFHFLILDPGPYTVTVSRTGFATTARDVIVTTGVNLELVFALGVAPAKETVTVTAETPVVDSKRVGTGTTLTQDELARTPNARDPWALLRTVPGILVDRDNIAGSWNHAQSTFVGKGGDVADNSFILDGTSITNDGGGSIAYYDFDAFQEIRVTTGGTDLRAQTGGITINFTTKRGTNQFHGSARGFFTHDSLEWSNLPASLVHDPRLELPNGTFSDQADHIRQLGDYGAEVGGPIVKDKLWAWLAYGRQDIRVVRLADGIGNPIKTDLSNWNAKLNWQASAKDMVSFSYFWAEKEKLNGNPGYASQVTDSSQVNQSNSYPSGPHGIYKLEESHVFSADWFLNATYAYYGWGYSVTPKGGPNEDFGVDTLLDISYGSPPSYRSRNQWQTADLDMRHFRSALGGNHELRFGFGYRRAPITSSSSYSGSKVLAFRFSSDGGVAKVHRDGVVSYMAQSWDGYLGDTYTRGRLTLNAGLRYDHQTASNLPSLVPANPVFPDLLPAVSFPGGGQGVRWRDLSPRVAVTYSLDAQSKTVVRASYARYAGRITAAEATFDNPGGLYGSYLAYSWVDRNHDGFAQRDEILINQGVLYASPGLDPAHPTSLTTLNKIDPNYTARHDDEIILGIERELAPGFILGAAYTWRRNTDRNWTPRIGLTGSDYTPNRPVTIDGFTAQTFSPDPAGVAAFGNGFVLTNRPDYRQRYNGLELSLAKRLSKKWMARAGIAYMDLHENFLGPAAIQNPTHTVSALGSGLGGPQIDGGQVLSGGFQLGGSVSARWQMNANALYELPLGLEAAASFWARQGFLKPYSLLLDAGEDGTLAALATPSVEDHRLPNVSDLDLRLAKSVKLGRRVALLAAADLFNVLNKGTVVNRNTIVNSPAFGQIFAILNPRIARFSVRLTF